MQIAIIDMGTNTFNLLVVGIANGQTRRLHSTKIAVKLGEGGFADKLIKEEAFKRGLLAIGEFMSITRQMGCEQVYAFATSAVRSATNGKLFTDAIYKQHKLKVDVINGAREAELIYRGVQETGVLSDETVLIMDIGGGSTEFILANEHQIFWKESFPLGAARLLERFTPSDPIHHKEVLLMEQYLLTTTENLFAALKLHPSKTLIGSSGSFDSIVDMWCAEQNLPLASELNLSNEISLVAYESMYNKLLASSKLERYSIPGLIPLRADFIVVSTLFIQVILKHAQINKILQSAYSLKEGVLAELKKQL